MKRHLVGTALFSLIVGTAIFATYYFVVQPKRAEVVSSPINETPTNESVYQMPLRGRANPIPSKMRMENVRFSTKMQKFNVTVDCKNTNPDKPYIEGDWGIKSMSRECAIENKFLHFFLISNGKPQYLFTKEVSSGLMETSGRVFMRPFDFEPLLKMKPFRNIYVMAEDKSDHKKNSTPTFVPDLAVSVVTAEF